MQAIAIDETLATKYPDAVCFEVVGKCCEPDVMEGQHVVLSNMEPLEPGRLVVFDQGRQLPRIGRITDIVGEFVKGCDNLGGRWVATVGDVLGQVVAVV